MHDTNQINIDGSGNITLQNIHGSTITIGKGDDAAAIMAKLEQLQEAQLDALQQIIGQQTERFSDLLKVLLKGVVAQKNIVSGSISNVGGDVHIGDNITYVIQPKVTLPPRTHHQPTQSIRLNQNHRAGAGFEAGTGTIAGKTKSSGG